MKERININLSTYEALILQQIAETGEEDVLSLSGVLGLKHQQVMNTLEQLRKKGLISIQRTASDWWVHASSKGKEFSRYIWPEMLASRSV